MEDIRIAMVQMTCRVGDVEGNLATMDRFCAEAAVAQVDIICFPELNVCGYNAGDPSKPDSEALDGNSVRSVEALAGKHGLTVLAGLLERGTNGIVYNTQIVCDPEGLMGSYRKTHVPTTEIGTFCHGDELPVFDHPKVRFGIEICYDTHFPEVSTLLAEKGADVIFCRRLERRQPRRKLAGCVTFQPEPTTTLCTWRSATTWETTRRGAIFRV